MRELRIDIDGISLSYREAGEGLPGQGLPLLILHGWGSSAERWERVQHALSKEGYRIIIPDLPGFGNTAPPPTVWGVAEYGVFMMHFMRELGIEQYALAGHSFGGAVAAGIAASHPEHVRHLILIAPAIVRHGSGIRGAVLKYASKSIGVLFYFAPEHIKTNIKTIGYKAIRRRDYLKTYGIMRDIFRRITREDLQGALSQITTPTLILWGANDKITPIRDGHEIEKQIPNATLKAFAGRSHALNMEDPEGIAKEISAFAKK